MIGLDSVLHLIRTRPEGEMGGADLHIADLAEAQRAAGTDVAVVSFGVNRPYAALLRDRGVACIEVPGESPHTWYAAARRAVIERHPSVVHSHGYRADLVAALLRWSQSGPLGARPAVAMTVHGFVRTGRLLRAMTRLNEACLRAADVAIATSGHEADRLAAKGLRNVRFIPNGVRPLPDASRDHLGQELGVRSDRRVLFIGRLAEEKRPDLFLDMARLLADDWPDLAFIVIGGGPLDAVMRAKAEQIGLSNRTWFAGLRGDVGQMLAGADVLVCPSDSEGTPRVVIEAMSCGVPVVATRVGGLPDLIADDVHGVLVPPGAARHLAGAVGDLLADPRRAGRIAEAAVERAQRDFSIERMAGQVARAYADIHNSQTEVAK